MQNYGPLAGICGAVLVALLVLVFWLRSTKRRRPRAPRDKGIGGPTSPDDGEPQYSFGRPPAGGASSRDIQNLQERLGSLERQVEELKGLIGQMRVPSINTQMIRDIAWQAGCEAFVQQQQAQVAQSVAQQQREAEQATEQAQQTAVCQLVEALSALTGFEEARAESVRLSTLAVLATQTLALVPDLDQACAAIRTDAANVERRLQELESDRVKASATYGLDAEAADRLRQGLPALQQSVGEFASTTHVTYERDLVNHGLAIMSALAAQGENPTAAGLRRRFADETSLVLIQPGAGERVDSRVHEAVSYIEGGKPDTIAEVKSIGFERAGKVLKKAVVIAYMA